MQRQIIPAREREPSFSEKLSQGVGRGLQEGSELYDQYQKKKQFEQQRQQENDTVRQLTGHDISGIQDDKMRQKILELTYQGMNQRNLEEFKQQGRKSRDTEKQNFLSQIFRGQNPDFTDQQPGQQNPALNDQGMQTGSNAQTQGFDPTQISDEDIARAASIDPVLGRELRAAKDNSMREKRAEQRFQFEKEKSSPENQRTQKISQAQAQADVKYNQSLQESVKLNELKEKTLSRLEQLNLKGVTGKPYEKILEKVGLVNQTSEGRREFAADVKNLITDIRSILGAQFTGFEFQTILNAYPSADFSQEANSAIINNLKEFQEIKKKEFEIATKLKKENGGKIPEDFQSKVNDKVHEYAISRSPQIRKNTQEIINSQYGIPKGHTLLLDPNGEPLSVPDNEVDMLIEEYGAQMP